MREMAEELNWTPHTKYQYYESRFKGEGLPSGKFFEIKGVLMRRGVPESEINRLLHKGIYDELSRLNQKVDEIREAVARLVEPEARTDPPTIPTRPHRRS